MRKCLYTYGWDFLDEGVDAVLERIKMLGIDAVAMAVSYHAGKFILPHNPKRRVHFVDDGTTYFIPRLDYYADTPLKPAPAPILEGRDILAEVAEGCLRRGLKLVAWTVFLHNSRLGMLHPGITAQNAFGDRYIYSLCPARPEVRAYALGLARNLVEHYGIETIFCESLAYLGFNHGYHHELYGVDLNPTHASLLSLCFCDACKNRAAQAGVDAGTTAALIRKLLADVFEDAVARPEPELAELVVSYPELAAYLKLRCDIVTNLVREVKSVAAQRGVGVDVFGPVFEPSCKQAFVEGTDIASLADLIDHYVVPGGHPDPQFVEDEVCFVKGKIAPAKMLLSINLLPQSAPTKEHFHEKLAIVSRHELAGCNIYNYSVIPRKRLEWIFTIPPFTAL